MQLASYSLLLLMFMIWCRTQTQLSRTAHANFLALSAWSNFALMIAHDSLLASERSYPLESLKRRAGAGFEEVSAGLTHPHDVTPGSHISCRFYRRF